MQSHTGNGIILSSLDSGSIEHCRAWNNGENCISRGGGPIGIWVWDARRVIIQFCEAFENKTGNQADGGGFDLDGGCVECIMQYNYSHDNHGAGFGIYQYSGAREFRDNIVRYNISENDGVNNHYGGIYLWSTDASGGIFNTRIYNNTVFVGESTRGAAIADIPDKETNYIHRTEVYNNVFVGIAGKPLIDVPNPSGEWTFAGNLYYTYGDEISIRWDGKEYKSVEEWTEATGQESLGGKPTGLEADPQLYKPGLAGIRGEGADINRMAFYRISPTSPAVGKGLNLAELFGWEPGYRDFFGTNITQVKRFDIGAHQVSEQ
jgi:hypothetical protein